MRRAAEKGLSRTMVAFLIGLTAFGLYLFSHELPAMRRYVRLKRM
jgi:hypothetical protein